MLSPTFLGVAVPAITFVLLTAVGCDLRVSDFRDVWRRPRIVTAGLLVPPLVLPALAAALIAWRSPPPAIASGLLLIAICPVGGISNTFTYLAHGSTALSLTLTGLSCLLAFLTVPVAGLVVGYATHGPSIAQVPQALLLVQLLATIVLPVSLGMVVRHRWPAFAELRQPSLQRMGFALLGALLATIIVADTRGFVAGLSAAVPLSAAFVAGSFVVGGGVGHVLGGDLRERIALAIEFATRNVAIATMLAVTLGRIEFATFATTYFLTELPVMLTAAAVFRAMVARNGARPGGRPAVAAGTRGTADDNQDPRRRVQTG